MEIRKATTQDFDRIMEIYASARRFMAEHGNPNQWGQPTYAVIEDGQWMDPGPYGVVHRIASDGSVSGAGAFCINWAFDQCGHMRIDTHGDNRVMQRLLEKLGFVRCGTIYVEEDDYPRFAYEKIRSF